MFYKTEILKDFIPQVVLDSIRETVEKDVANLINNDSVGAVHGTYYPVSNEIHDRLRKLLPLLDEEKLYVSYLKHSQPTGPHTDTNISPGDTSSDPNKFARTFIIPLETQDTNTITFNEYMEHGSVGEQMHEFIAALPETNSITEEIYKQYLNWETEKLKFYYSRLSVEIIFPWIAGDVLIFDRKRIHTGDNHLNKMTNKQALIVWSQV